MAEPRQPVVLQQTARSNAIFVRPICPPLLGPLLQIGAGVRYIQRTIIEWSTHATKKRNPRTPRLTAPETLAAHGARHICMLRDALAGWRTPQYNTKPSKKGEREGNPPTTQAN